MCVALDMKTAFAGFLNEKIENDQQNSFVTFTPDNLSEYTKKLWNAGCGPVIEDYSRRELLYYLDSNENCLDCVVNRYCSKWRCNEFEWQRQRRRYSWHSEWRCHATF